MAERVLYGSHPGIACAVVLSVQCGTLSVIFNEHTPYTLAIRRRTYGAASRHHAALNAHFAEPVVGVTRRASGFAEGELVVTRDRLAPTMLVTTSGAATESAQTTRVSSAVGIPMCAGLCGDVGEMENVEVLFRRQCLVECCSPPCCLRNEGQDSECASELRVVVLSRCRLQNSVSCSQVYMTLMGLDRVHSTPSTFGGVP